MTYLSRILSAVLVVHACSVFAAKQKKISIDPLVLEAMKWEKKAVTLEKVLKSNGWWKSEKGVGTGPAMLVLENVKFTAPYTVVVKGRGIASHKSAHTIEYVGKYECLQTEKHYEGSKTVFKYDKSSEKSVCWITKPVAEGDTKESHLFTVYRSSMKGSSAYKVESAEIVLDRQLKPKGIHPLALKIAQQVGAL